MKRIETLASIEAGKLAIKQREKFASAVADLPEGDYFLILEKIYAKRSIKQNRAKFGIPYKILQSCFIESTGERVSIDWIHEFCKERFLPGEYVEQLREEWEQKKSILIEKSGEVIEMPFRLTTTKMNTVQEMKYYESMQRFGSEFFYVDIPDPDPNYKNKYS